MARFDIEIFSVSLNRTVNFKMYIPNDPNIMRREDDPYIKRGMKVLFLLHGYTGSAYYWGYEHLAQKYNFAMVMPSGENSFYLDGAATGHKYCTYIGKELVEYIRSTFGIGMTADDTYICGLSMGGFGALHTALAYPDTFGKAGAMSSALIMHEVAGMTEGYDNGMANYEYYRECFGEPSKVLESDANPEELVRRIKASGGKLPEIYMCCGTEDFLIEPNRSFHRFLEGQGVNHIYNESKGVHDGVFWDEYTPKIMDWMFKE